MEKNTIMNKKRHLRFVVQEGHAVLRKLRGESENRRCHTGPLFSYVRKVKRFVVMAFRFHQVAKLLESQRRRGATFKKRSKRSRFEIMISLRV